VSHLPCPEIVDVLLPAFAPCRHLTGACREARWEPTKGHVPRGFVGALGTVAEVKIVLLTAEPGDPFPGEDHSEPTSIGILAGTTANYFDFLLHASERSGMNHVFPKKMRRLLDICWPDTSFDEQLRRTWITDTYLCSAKKESGPVAVDATRTCAETYLRRCLAVFSDPLIVALGGKATQRCKQVGVKAESAFSVASPGSNYKGAEESWLRLRPLLESR
jgi:hypothetical protein